MFIHREKINFYDCDPAGILFYARIYEVCHAAYEAMIESFKPVEDYWNNEGYVVPIIHSEAKYRKPFKYGDEIEVELKVNSLKTTSFELNYTCRNQIGELCTEVKTVHVFVDKKTWQKKAIVERVQAGLKQHV